MKTLTTNWKAGLVALLVIMLAGGCETQLIDLNKDEIEEPELSELYTEITRDLTLSEQEQREVRRIFVRHQRNHGQPGNLWRIAAGLQERLTDEQKQRLFSMIEGYEDRLAQAGKLWIFDNWVAPMGPPAHRPNCNPQLTPEQLREIKALRERFGELLSDLRAAFEAGEITAEEFRRRYRALREALQAAYEDILTEEQLRRMRLCLQNAGEHLRNATGRGLEIIIAVLELNREQVQALLALQQEQREGYARLLRLLRQEEITREEFIDGIIRLREAREAQLKEILDRRQYEIVKIHQGLTLRMMINRMQHGQTR